ncbi:MAG TPA: hypothetical protein VNE58_00410 [Casimicrobiaceae bacterium]|nr:hypothetical protein [Casimicrobiaceae bacterium]
MFATQTLRISAGAILWAAHFTSIYGLTAIACTRQAGAAVPWIVVITTLLFVTPTGILAWRWYRQRDAFESWLAASVAAIAVPSMILEAAAALAVRSCG